MEYSKITAIMGACELLQWNSDESITTQSPARTTYVPVCIADGE